MSFFENVSVNMKRSSTPLKSTKAKTQKKKAMNETIEPTSDILYIDRRIKDILKSKVSSLSDMQKTLSQLIWIAGNGIDNFDKLSAKKESEIIRRAIQDIEGGFDLSLYLLKTSSLLEEYAKLVSETQSNSFMRSYENLDEKKNFRKREIVLEFLRIAKDYIKLDGFTGGVGTSPTCDACHSTDLEPGSVDYTLICNKCGVQMDLLDDSPSFKDSERVNMSARYTYTCKGHFIEAMNRFEGKQNTEIPQNVIQILNKELEIHGFNEKNKSLITKDHIYMFLSEKGLSDFYADINLIYFMVSGVNPPDITAYRNELLDMLEQLEEAYLNVKESGRMNSLNVNWKLYKLLQLLDYPCQKDDFFCLKTPTKQGEHEEKWFEMIDYLKDTYPNAKTSKGKTRWRHIRSI